MLYIVATPIGNLEDITLRALRILREVDFILCEDTRVTKRLLEKYEITTPSVSYHQHSSDAKINKIIDRLQSGESAALVTDAGTPGISDPGNILIDAILRFPLIDNLRIVPIPGSSALTTALSIAGASTDRFWFLGFLPHKKGKQTLFELIANTKETVVFYESNHRIRKTLETLARYIGNRPVVVCRELTKMFETIYRGTISEVLEELDERGEFVVIICGPLDKEIKQM